MVAAAMTNTRSFVGHRVAAVKNGSRVVMKAGNWLPGSDTPAYLENLPASYGIGATLGLSVEVRTRCRGD